ncbi:MAG: hypothetical protein M3Z10_13025 [Gemmatimonadota bacterium]|nr:hypothetical protein [Gemmatimonadota bacterium]
MNRCVAIHINGMSEILDVQPRLHQELRGLGYRRFVVRTADGRALSSAVYSRRTPSTWQCVDAARKLWGLSAAVNVFDEHGELMPDVSTPPIGVATVDPRVDRPASVADTEVPLTRSEDRRPESTITEAMVADLRRAAHEIRLNLGDWLYGTGDGSEQRAFADRLDAHVRALAQLATRGVERR